ncbi:MAG: restriction endonuclease [Chloroflexi bacterium]|nr:restriction endonuclease [Chloroflexota bacterium]
MAIPDFQTLMLPLLEIAGDGKEHSLADVIDLLAERFHLTAEERAELLPSGTQSKFVHRVGWARTDLREAGLLERTGRARFRITDRGLAVLRGTPQTINRAFLRRFLEFDEFLRRTRRGRDEDGNAAIETEIVVPTTPEETLGGAYQTVRQALAQELLGRIRSCSPRFFERLVVDLLVAMGYGGSRKDAGRAVGQSGDGGIDGVIKEDKLGLDVVYVQAKRWDNTVGRPIVQTFAGSLEGQRARKGVLITTSQFSPDAKEYVKYIEKKIVLVDGEQLAQLMIDHGIGVTELATYTVKKLDLDYFEEE